jgi:hypothetical protein
VHRTGTSIESLRTRAFLIQAFLGFTPPIAVCAWLASRVLRIRLRATTLALSPNYRPKLRLKKVFSSAFGASVHPFRLKTGRMADPREKTFRWAWRCFNKKRPKAIKNEQPIHIFEL